MYKEKRTKTHQTVITMCLTFHIHDLIQDNSLPVKYNFASVRDEHMVAL